MSLTEFAMVEELAFLVKDNLPCKHLVLSMEEAFVNLLQDKSSSDGRLELEPMNAYNRLLLHRLADIFGFSHHSVGEGDDRHLILERCPETSIPSVLVSDLLWQYDELELPTSHRLLKRNDEASPAMKAEKTATQFSLEEREAAYMAARERIFTRYECETSEPMKQKPRSIPIVARRMIVHALGGRINSSNQEVGLKNTKEYGERTENIREKEQGNTSLSIEAYQNGNPCHKPKVYNFGNDKAPAKLGISQPRRREVGGNKDNLKEEHMGAAKRMFAHALGTTLGKRDNPSDSHQLKRGTMQKADATLRHFLLDAMIGLDGNEINSLRSKVVNYMLLG